MISVMMAWSRRVWNSSKYRRTTALFLSADMTFPSRRGWFPRPGLRAVAAGGLAMIGGACAGLKERAREHSALPSLEPSRVVEKIRDRYERRPQPTQLMAS